ncbi:hypothetical protein V7S43_011692 [Phytophthora oleae]|uniref:Uncharacterized protein n=1 Tax=Phytophthora oleae TaxID=2107226 RepID=A0ABD3F982_9STRA
MHVTPSHMAFQVMREGAELVSPSAIRLRHITQLIGLLLANFPGMTRHDSLNTEVRLITVHQDHPYALHISEEAGNCGILAIVGEHRKRKFYFRSGRPEIDCT